MCVLSYQTSLCTYSFKIGDIFHSKTPHNDSHTHALITHEREREREREERERTTINCTTTCVTTLQNNNTMSEEEEQQEQLRRRLENKEMELLEPERCYTHEREGVSFATRADRVFRDEEPRVGRGKERDF